MIPQTSRILYSYPVSSFFKISVSIFFFLILPFEKTNSCYMPASADRESYYFSIFQTEIANAGGLEPFLYSMWGYNKRHDGFMVADTAYYFINVAEWRSELRTAVNDKDIYDILYKTEPEEFRQKEKALSAKNTFIKAVKQRADLWEYLKFAKECESNMAPVEWEQSNLKEMKDLTSQGKRIISRSSSEFVKLRTAYLTMKIYHYLNDSSSVKDMFNHYFKNSTSKSWIIGSSYFYNALAQSDLVQRNLALTQTFIKSVDKRKQAVLYFLSDSLNIFLKATKDKNIKSGLYVLAAYNAANPQLNNIKKIYQLTPQNRDIATLLHSEVTKLEDWLLTPEVTDFKHYNNLFKQEKTTKREVEYGFEDEIYYQDIEDDELASKQRKEQYRKQNRQKDLNYCNELIQFISQLLQEGKQRNNQALLLIAAAHLNFIKKDWEGFNQFIKQVEVLPNLSYTMQMQIKLSRFATWVSRQNNFNTPSVQEQFLDFFDDLDKNKNKISDYKFLRSQLALYCANEFIRRKDIAKGVLMLSKTDRQWGTYAEILIKNLYHKLLEVAEAKDYEEIISILNSNNKSRLESFLTNEPEPYIGNFDNYYSLLENGTEDYHPAHKWDIDKIKEYQSMYFLRKGDIQKATLIINTIPNSFWKHPLFESYLNTNTFHVELSLPNEGIKKDVIRFTKKQVLNKMMALITELEKDPVKYADNNLWLGNAYYNMSNRGNSWLMWDVYDQAPSLTQPLRIAEKYFKTCLETTSNPKIAAYSYCMANLCREKFIEIDDFNNSYTNTFKKRFPNEKQMATMKYWCQEKYDEDYPTAPKVKNVVVRPFNGIMPNKTWGLLLGSFAVAFALVSLLIKLNVYE